MAVARQMRHVGSMIRPGPLPAMRMAAQAFSVSEAPCKQEVNPLPLWQPTDEPVAPDAVPNLLTHAQVLLLPGGEGGSPSKVLLGLGSNDPWAPAALAKLPAGKTGRDFGLPGLGAVGWGQFISRFAI